MSKLSKTIFTAIFIVLILVTIVIVVFFRMWGTNFVHDRPASPEYYAHIQNRISFSAKFRGEEFDSLLNAFLKQNPKYTNDSIGTGIFKGDTCDCNCLVIKRTINFPDSPQELYVITFDYGEMQGGIIDIVYQYRDSNWICLKSSRLDSSEKVRIENRFENEIVKRLK